MKSLWRLLVSFGLICGLIFFAGMSPAFAAQGTASEADFQVHVSAGLNGSYKLGAPVPVSLELTSVGEDFEGVVRVIVPGESDYQEATAYEKDVMLSADTEKTIDFSVRGEGLQYNSKVKLELEDSSGSIVCEQEVDLKLQSQESILVGILSEDTAALNYFDGIYPDVFSSHTQIVELSEATLPESSEGLNALGYLIINSFDTSLLNEQQNEAIREWVQDGGILLIGTGSDYRQTLSSLQDGFVSGQIGGTIDGTLSLLGGGESLDFSASDGIAALSLNDGETLSGVLTMPELIWRKSCGDGAVVVTAFNLGMEPVNSWSQKGVFASELLSAAVNEAQINRIDELNYYSGSDYWYYSSSLDALHDTLRANNTVFAVLFFVFVILAGPIGYLILKKADRREWLWCYVPVLSAAAVCAVFLLSLGMRTSSPRAASASVLFYDASTDTKQEDVYLALQVPRAQKVSVTLSDQLRDVRLMQSTSSSLLGYSVQTEAYQYTRVLREQSGGYLLTSDHLTTFESDYLQAVSVSEENPTSGLETAVTRTLSGISGTVTNHTGYTLYGVSVLSGSRAVMVGTLEDGDSFSFTEADNQFYSQASSLYNLYYDMELSDTDLTRRLQANADFINELYSELEDSQSDSVDTLAWIPDWEADYMIDEGVKESNTAWMICRNKVPYENYEHASSLMLYDYTDYTLSDVSSQWDNDGWMYASDIEVAFNLSERMNEVYALVRVSDADSQWGTSGNVKIYGYNLKTGAYDELFTDDSLIMEFPDGCPYIDESGVIRMRFTTTSGADVDYAPEITVIGGNADAEN